MSGIKTLHERDAVGEPDQTGLVYFSLVLRLLCHLPGSMLMQQMHPAVADRAQLAYIWRFPLALYPLSLPGLILPSSVAVREHLHPVNAM
jgi:hypothetical protein